MSGFFGSGEPNRWGGLLKQAISNVENTFDNLLIDQPNGNAPPSSSKPDKQHTNHDSEAETETFMDPISGMVTTIQRPKRTAKSPGTPRSTEKDTQDLPRQSPDITASERRSSDLSSRLAAIMAEKTRQGKTSRPSSIASTNTNKEVDTSKDIEIETAQKSQSQNQAEDKQSDNSVVAAESLPVAEEPGVDSDDKKREEEEEDSKKSIEKDRNADISETSPDYASKDHGHNDSRDRTILADTEKLPGNMENAGDSNEHAVPAVNSSSSDPILKQREMQLFQAMQTIAKLHDQIHSLQEEVEKQQKENEAILAELKATRSASTNAADQRHVRKLEAQIEELKQQVASKSEQIQGLMEEGEKLSKTELKHGNVIKKLRSEKQDLEKIVADLQKKVEKSSSELVEANVKMMRVSESEKRLQESFKAVSDLTERQTKHMNKLETELRDWKEKYNSKEAALKDALANLEVEREKARAESQQEQSVLLEEEQRRNEELKAQLEILKENAKKLETRLRKEIKDLQNALHTSQSDAGKREDQLMDEIKDLQGRLQSLDMSSAELDTKIEEATAPLLQQIDMLQTQHSAALKHRDHAEQEVALRLQTIEKERDEYKALLQDMSNKYSAATEQLEQLQLQMIKQQEEVAKQESKANEDAALIDEQREQIQRLQTELDSYREKETNLEKEIKTRYQKIMKERIQEERRQWEIKTGVGAMTKIPANGPKELNGDRTHTSKPEASPQLSIAHSPASSPRSSTDVGVAGTTFPPVSERFQGNIRHLENQLSFYQTQLQSALQSRDELSEEILNMNIEMENLRKENRKVHDLERRIQELDQRYHASLELLGERTEQVEELKADIADVKEMYRNQIVELVQKIDRLEKGCT